LAISSIIIYTCNLLQTFQNEITTNRSLLAAFLKHLDIYCTNSISTIITHQMLIYIYIKFFKWYAFLLKSFINFALIIWNFVYIFKIFHSMTLQDLQNMSELEKNNKTIYLILVYKNRKFSYCDIFLMLLTINSRPYTKLIGAFSCFCMATCHESSNNLGDKWYHI